MRNEHLEDLIHKNLNSLSRIMSGERTKLLDTGVLVGIPGFEGIVKVSKGKLMDVNSENLEQYSYYFNNIFECLDSFDSNVTVSEVIEEIFVFKDIFSKKIKRIDDFMCKCRRLGEEQKKKFKHIKDIWNYFKKLENLLENRRYERGLVFNQFSEEIYDLYKLFVNQSYNIFRKRGNDDIEDEPICADDAVIAGSLMLLQRKKEPIIVVSNDMGVSRRLRISKSLLYCLNKEYLELPKIVELNNLLNSEGISFYSALNDDHIYRFFGTTQCGGLRYYLKRTKKEGIRYSIKQWKYHINYFIDIIKDINSLEEKYAEMI